MVLESINTRETLAIPAASAEGGFSENDVTRASQLLRDPRTSQVRVIDATLLDLVYRIQCHFSAQSVRVISAFRTPSGPRESRHGQGKALDIVVPGASDRAVAAFVRGLGPHGVGLYPRSGFVHIDVRETSHFWVDNSGPGQRPRAHAVAKKRHRKRVPAVTPQKAATESQEPNDGRSLRQ